MSLPATITNPGGFLRSPSAGFDGVFDWSWTQGCFGQGRIKPMDFDGVVERNGNFILFETKNVGVEIPRGQLITLNAAHRLGCFTIMLIYGKTSPESAEIWYPGVPAKDKFFGLDAIRGIVANWYQHADKNPYQKIDVSMLNRRIYSLQSENSAMQENVSKAAELAKQIIDLLSKSGLNTGS